MIGSKVWLVAAVAVAAVAASEVNAQTNLKVGVINVGRLVEGSPQFAAARKKLEDEFGPRQRDLQAMEQKLRTQQETFQRDAPVMGEQERLNLERQIRDGQREFQRTQNEVVEDFNLRQNEELGALQREVILRAQQYAREQNYDLLLADQSVIFASTAVDITAAVLAVLQPAGSGGRNAPASGSNAPASGESPPASGGRRR
jgi:outer membrane protein